VSFKRRLTLLTAGAVAIAIVIAAASAYLLVRAELRGQIDEDLRRQAEIAAGAAAELREPDVAPPGFPPAQPGTGGPFQMRLPSILPAPPEIAGAEAVAQVVTPSGDVLDTVGLDDTTLPAEPALAFQASGSDEPVLSDVEVEGSSLRMIVAPLDQGGVLQLARSLEEVDDSLQTLALVMGLIALCGVAVAAGLGIVVSEVALRPVRKLTEASEDVARTEDLTRRIDVSGDDELARLGTAFNGMLAALEVSVGAQRRLVADASHELRTPITSLRTNIETLHRRPDMDHADRDRLLADLESELVELGRLVDDIVDLARQGSEPTADPVDVRLDEVVAAVAERARRRTEEGVELRTALEPSVVRGSPERLDRAVGNLIDNAVKWTPAGGTIDVAVRDGRVTVADSGPGIDPADREHVFERFWRAPAARGMPGSGLGLAIAEQVATAHGGTVSVGDSPTGGALFRLELPG
jgi:two-component system sensor histidine kinase MprB